MHPMTLVVWSEHPELELCGRKMINGRRKMTNECHKIDQELGLRSRKMTNERRQMTNECHKM